MRERARADRTGRSHRHRAGPDGRSATRPGSRPRSAGACAGRAAGARRVLTPVRPRPGSDQPRRGPPGARVLRACGRPSRARGRPGPRREGQRRRRRGGAPARPVPEGIEIRPARHGSAQKRRSLIRRDGANDGRGVRSGRLGVSVRGRSRSRSQGSRGGPRVHRVSNRAARGHRGRCPFQIAFVRGVRPGGLPDGAGPLQHRGAVLRGQDLASPRARAGNDPAQSPTPGCPIAARTRPGPSRSRSVHRGGGDVRPGDEVRPAERTPRAGKRDSPETGRPGARAAGLDQGARALSARVAPGAGKPG